MSPFLSTIEHPALSRRVRRRAFTLVELLVVVALIVLMMSLAVPAFNSIRGGADFTSEVYNIAGTLDQARAYAVANNTYTLVGIEEVSSAVDASVTPQVSGTGRIAMAIIASRSGLRSYQSMINLNTLGSWKISASGYGSGAAFAAVTKLAVFPNIHLVDLQNSNSTPPASGGMARPAVSIYYNLSNGNGTSSTQFAWPLGTKLFPPTATPTAQYVFNKVIEFDPEGSARFISTGNTASMPDAIPQYIEIGIQPAHGGAVAGPPGSQETNPGQIAAIQINGINGNVQMYRP